MQNISCMIIISGICISENLQHLVKRKAIIRTSMCNIKIWMVNMKSKTSTKSFWDYWFVSDTIRLWVAVRSCFYRSQLERRRIKPFLYLVPNCDVYSLHEERFCTSLNFCFTQSALKDNRSSVSLRELSFTNIYYPGPKRAVNRVILVMSPRRLRQMFDY